MSTDALQQSLAAEHAAVWVFALLGGQTSQAAEPALYAEVTTAYRTHRGRRDTLRRIVTDAGATPVPAEAGYAVGPTDTADQIRAVALETERRCAATYADLVARTSGDRRAWAITALTDAAVRQLRFRGSPETFPGAEELADR